MDQVNDALGQRMADMVAKFGGGWGIVFMNFKEEGHVYQS